MKRSRKIVVRGGIMGTLLLGAVWTATDYFYRLAIDATTSKKIVSNGNAVVLTVKRDAFDYKKWMVTKSGMRNVYTTSWDGLRLHRYEIRNKAEGNRYAILIHGYDSNGISMAEQAKYFYDLGYHVIVPELRGHGGSEGTYIGMGWHDRLDVLQIVEEIVSREKEAKIVLYGISMGAATVLMASGEPLPSNVVAVIEDCGYTSAWEEFEYQLHHLFSLPAVPLLYTTDWMTRHRAGYGFSEASAIAQVRKSVTPTLFIHGTEDTFVPFSMLGRLYEACNAPKEKFVVEGAGHAQSMEKHPEAYKEELGRFLRKYGR